MTTTLKNSSLDVEEEKDEAKDADDAVQEKAADDAETHAERTETS